MIIHQNVVMAIVIIMIKRTHISFQIPASNIDIARLVYVHHLHFLMVLRYMEGDTFNEMKPLQNMKDLSLP